MFRTTHIRTKLAVALAVPLAALVAVAGFEVVSARQDVSDARSQSELASASLGPGSLVVNLQNERNRAAIDLIGLGSAAATFVFFLFLCARFGQHSFAFAVVIGVFVLVDDPLRD